MLRLMPSLAIALVGTSGCVLPQHRAVATVINTAVVGTGIALSAAIASDRGNPDSLHLFDEELSNLAVGAIALGAVGELFTLLAHHGEPEVMRPAPAPIRDVALSLSLSDALDLAHRFAAEHALILDDRVLHARFERRVLAWVLDWPSSAGSTTLTVDVVGRVVEHRCAPGAASCV